MSGTQLRFLSVDEGLTMESADGDLVAQVQVELLAFGILNFFYQFVSKWYQFCMLTFSKQPIAIIFVGIAVVLVVEIHVAVHLSIVWQISIL